MGQDHITRISGPRQNHKDSTRTMSEPILIFPHFKKNFILQPFFLKEFDRNVQIGIRISSMSKSICIFHKQLLVRNTHTRGEGKKKRALKWDIKRMNKAAADEWSITATILISLWKLQKNIEIGLFWQFEQHSGVYTCLRIIVIYLIILKSL